MQVAVAAGSSADTERAIGAGSGGDR